MRLRFVGARNVQVVPSRSGASNIKTQGYITLYEESRVATQPRGFRHANVRCLIDLPLAAFYPRANESPQMDDNV